MGLREIANHKWSPSCQSQLPTCLRSSCKPRKRRKVSHACSSDYEGLNTNKLLLLDENSLETVATVNGPKKHGTEADSVPAKKNKRFANLLTRSRSIRVDDGAANRPRPRRPSIGLAKLEEFGKTDASQQGSQQISSPINLQPERPTRLVNPADLPSSVRRDKSAGGSMVPSNSLSQVSGASAAIFNTFKQSSSGAADRLGKAGKGFFGKITRSGSTNERDLINDDSYVCNVINLSLLEQARKTRIAKKLEDCRDKTEFWMPALPYRCIE